MPSKRSILADLDRLHLSYFVPHAKVNGVGKLKAVHHVPAAPAAVEPSSVVVETASVTDDQKQQAAAPEDPATEASSSDATESSGSDAGKARRARKKDTPVS